MQINAGLERIISVFEDGWASGVIREGALPPSYVEPALREYWHDGYQAALADRVAETNELQTTH